MTIVYYFTVALFVAGTAWRVAGWLRRPVPVSVSLDQHRGELGWGEEFFLFASLWRGDRRLWAGAWLLHVGLALIIVGHVAGIAALGEQFCAVGASSATSRLWSHGLGVAAGVIFLVALAALWLRRLMVAELRRISDFSDHFALALLAAVALSGMAMRLPGSGVDLAAVRTYLAGLLTFRPGPLPQGPLFLVHFTLVNVLLVYFPFSKLLHGIGGVVNRAILTAAPPIYPTPAGFQPDGRFQRL